MTPDTSFSDNSRDGKDIMEDEREEYRIIEDEGHGQGPPTVTKTLIPLQHMDGPLCIRFVAGPHGVTLEIKAAAFLIRSDLTLEQAQEMCDKMQRTVDAAKSRMDSAGEDSQ